MSAWFAVTTWDGLSVSGQLTPGYSPDRYRVEFEPRGEGLRKGGNGAIGRGSLYSRLNVSGSMVRPSPSMRAVVPVCRDGVAGCDVAHRNADNTHAKRPVMPRKAARAMAIAGMLASLGGAR